VSELLNQSPPWWRRIGFRLGLLVVGCVIVGEMLALPLWDILGDAIDGPQEGGPPPAWYEGWTLVEFVGHFGILLVIGLIAGGVLGVVASSLFARRLRGMAAIASTGDSEDGTRPGPYPEGGDDEITRLARALNHSRERAADLLERLARRDASRSEWVAQVSHDLRTPLAALRTCLEHADSRLESGSATPEELHQLLAVAADDAERVSHLAADLLDLARLEIEPDLRRETVLPFEVAERTLHLLQPLLSERGVEVELRGDSELPEVRADGRLVCRALENLLANSLEHARERVELRITGTAEAVRFAVLDDGPGLATGGDSWPRDCVDFVTLRAQRSRPDSVGLGLMVTQRVASVHGGDAGARNRAEGGAEVWFELAAG